MCLFVTGLCNCLYAAGWGQVEITYINIIYRSADSVMLNIVLHYVRFFIYLSFFLFFVLNALKILSCFSQKIKCKLVIIVLFTIVMIQLSWRLKQQSLTHSFHDNGKIVLFTITIKYCQSLYFLRFKIAFLLLYKNIFLLKQIIISYSWSLIERSNLT